MERPEEQLRKQGEFQQLLIELATGFINLPLDQFDERIIRSLQRIVEFIGAMRCTINQFSENRKQFFRLYEWTSPAFSHIPEKFSETPNSSVMLAELEQGETLIVNDINTTQYLELAELVRPYGINALIVVPILDSGKLFGFVSMSWPVPTEIGPEIGHLLKVVGGIFLNALERKQNEVRIQNLNADLEQRVADRTSELMHANDQLQNEIRERQAVETTLRESERQLRAILDNLPIPIVVVNEQRALLYVNPVVASIVDIDISENTNVTSIFSIDPEDRLKIDEQVRTQGYAKDIMVRYLLPDGTGGTALVSIQSFQFAAQAALLIAVVDVTELKRIQEAEREQRTLTEALLDSAMALTSTLEFGEVVKHILHSVNLVVPHDIANVMILDGDEAVVLGSRDNIPDSLNYKLIKKRFNFKEDYVGQRMLQTRQPVIIGDITNDPNFVRIGQGPVLRGYLGLPIIVGKEIIGVISLGSQTADHFNQSHARYLQIFALQAGIAIQNARLYEQAKAIAGLEERQKLARDLHDSVSQTLFSANSIAEGLPQLIGVNLEKTQQYLNDLHLLTHTAMAEMRSLLIELRPEALEQMELDVLLNQLCDVFTGKTQIELEKDIKRRVLLPPETQMAFYRIAQEALNNVAKHARATRVCVTLQSTNRVIELKIRDNGSGFDPAQVSAGHFGLKIMRERADAAHIDLAIGSQKNQGTEVILRSA